MNPWIRKAILIVFIGVGATVIAAVVAATALQGKITEKIKDEINKQVTVPVQVDGGMELSLLRHFPYASLTLKKVSIDDKLQKGKKLLDVGEFSLLCNIFSLFGDKIELSKIYINNGVINVYTDEQGKTNYDIFRPSQDTTGSKVAVRLKKAEIRNVKFTYYDKALSTDVGVNVKDITLSGNFNQAQFDLASTINATVDKIISSGQSYVQKRRIKAGIVLSINTANRQYTFKKSRIAIDDNEFDITGFFALLKNGTQLDFQLTNKGRNIQKLFGLIPEKWRKSFEGAEGSGEYLITANVKGMAGGKATPHINVSADVKHSQVKLGKYNKLLKEVNATANYEMDEHGNDKLVISNFNCLLNELPFNFRLTLDKLSNPSFDFYAHGVFHLTELSTFIPDSVLNDIGGKITFNDFHLKGRKADFTDVEHSTLTGSGEFRLSDVQFQQNGISYGNINGLLIYKGKSIEARNLTTNFLSNEAVFSGNIENIIAFAYNLSSNRSANNVVLGVNGMLKVKTLNLSGILDAYKKKNHPQAVTKGKIDVREILNMQGNLEVQIDKFMFRKMEFDHIKGSIGISPGIIRCSGFNMQGMGGDMGMNGKIVFGDDYSISMNYNVNAGNLNVPDIFSECENFGQTSLTDKHLKGRLNAQIALAMTFVNYNELDPNSVNALVNFDIKDGELIKFEPLRAASKFIKVQELQDIHFADLSNTIKIANQRIDIPQFEIQSSALNLMIDGYHYFNDSIDYHLKINLHKLLAQKFKRRQVDLQYMEDDPYEGVNIYLSVKGSLREPQIKLDKSAGRNKMKDDFVKGKQNLKNLLNNNPAVVNDNDKKREDKYYDVQKEPQFIDFDSTGK